MTLSASYMHLNPVLDLACGLAVFRKALAIGEGSRMPIHITTFRMTALFSMD
jgi:hypothetical protein